MIPHSPKNGYTLIDLGGRQSKFLLHKSNQTKMGINSLVSKFYVLNNQIDLSDLNTSLDTIQKHNEKLI